jgi:hypothetical protein
MAGSPIKAARRMGVDIPNLGDKAPRHDWPPGRVRVANRIPTSELPNDADLLKEAKCVLLEIAREGGGPESNARMGAARALADLVGPAEPVKPEQELTADERRMLLVADPKLREMARNWDDSKQ